jgi:hypothetical protein
MLGVEENERETTIFSIPAIWHRLRVCWSVSGHLITYGGIMKEIPATEIPYLQGCIQKYYKYGLWHYKAIILSPYGILSGVFYSIDDAKQYIQERS